MCGFLGAFSKKEISGSRLDSALSLIRHRGPDHLGYDSYEVLDSYLYLGHARLSIIDLSSDGTQPFDSACGLYSIVFNGEIYNYRELKLELVKLGYSFHSETDTEVLLYSFIEWGKACLTRLVGMFSFVFYDKKNQRLTFIRDAFGIKPFFYSFHECNLYFSSELSPLLQLSEGSIRPNLQRAYDYLVHGDYDSDSQSFVEGVKHLEPGHLFTYELLRGEATNPHPWWQPNISTRSKLSFEEATVELRRLFLESIKLHLRSDVPFGVALSGGIDSSSVVCAVRQLEPDLALQTFSYIASDQLISEEMWVDQINDEMNCAENKVFANHNEMRVDLDEMLLRQGEPVGGTSIYAQYRVFKLAQQKGVTVTLDGQGADELLAGYIGYPGHRLLSLVEDKGWAEAYKYSKRWAKSTGHHCSLAWKYFFRLMLPDWAYYLARKKMGRSFKPSWLNTDYLEMQGVRFGEKRPSLERAHRGTRVKEALLNALTGRGLPSLLRHGDRNSMAFSIESRVPFLTIPIADFLLSLPEHYLLSDDGVSKYIFREAMRGIVPDSHLDRKDKIGFTTPESEWLMNMLSDITIWVNESPKLPFLKKSNILKELEEIKNGKRSFDGRVWRWVNYVRWCSLLGISGSDELR